MSCCNLCRNNINPNPVIRTIVGPRGPMGPAGVFSPAYGGIYGEQLADLVIPALNTVRLNLSSQMPVSNITYSSNTMTIMQTGKYEISFFVSAAASAVAFNGFITARRNGVSLPGMLYNHTFTTDLQTISLSTIASLTVGDVLDLAIGSSAGGTVTFGTLISANLKAVKLSQ